MDFKDYDLPLSAADEQTLAREAREALPSEATNNGWYVAKRLFKVNVLALAFMLFTHWLIGAPTISPMMVFTPIVSLAMLPFIICQANMAANRGYERGLKFALCMQVFTMHLSAKRKSSGPVTHSEKVDVARETQVFLDKVMSDELLTEIKKDDEYIYCGTCGQRLGVVDQKCPICKAMSNDPNTLCLGSGSVPDGDRSADQGDRQTAQAAQST